MPLALDQPQIDCKRTFEIPERYDHRLAHDFLSPNPEDRPDPFTGLRHGLDAKFG